MKIRVLLALIALFVLAAPGVSSAGPRKSGATIIPCGTMGQAYFDVYNRTASERTYRATFTAFGGGSVWFVVPPSSGSIIAPPDNTSRAYTITLTIPVDAQIALPRQVIGAANQTSCGTGPLQVDNVQISVVP